MDDLERLKSDPLLTPAAVASVLGLGIECLSMWRKKGIGLPWVKYHDHRGSVRYRASDVVAFIEARTVQVKRLPHPRAGEPTKRARKLAEPPKAFSAPLGRKTP